jgi:hypothetical protein
VWGEVVRVERIELSTQAWEARVLPLNYTRRLGWEDTVIWGLVQADFLSGPTRLGIIRELASRARWSLGHH